MRLHDTMAGKVEPFVPLEEGRVRMYHCGPTVYKAQHVGNYRAYALADLLRRTFEYLGYEVTQIINITDVGHLTEDDVADATGEDKLQEEAARRQVDPWTIAREEEARYLDELAVLRMKPAHAYPRATEHIEEMLRQIEVLLEKGHAYEAGGNVYFDVSSFAEYGKLSGNTPAQLEAGAGGRVEERSDKRSPHDFALWKRDEKHLMQWDAPWGRGFPGWHIECSAMSMKYLGETLDIHTGGPDNIFPHHECEIAQAESITGKPFARHWVHCGWLEIAGGKMSKSEGRMYTVPELLAMGYAGADIRLFLIKQHYHAPLPFSLELLDEAKAMRAQFHHFLHFELAERPEGDAQPAVTEAVDAARARFRAALEDDLNTSAAFAALHTLMSAVNRAGPNAGDAGIVRAFFREADTVLAILDEAEEATLDAEVEALLVDREAARAAKDFAKADAIRDALLARGIELLDTPRGTRWKKR